MAANQVNEGADWKDDMFDMELPGPLPDSKAKMLQYLHKGKYRKAIGLFEDRLDVDAHLELKAQVHEYVERQLSHILKFIRFPDGSISTGDLVHRGAASDNLDLLKLALAIGYSVNARDESGKTPIMYAIGKPSTFQFLLARADLTLTDFQGLTVLNLAIMGGHVATIEGLLKMDSIGINKPDVYRNYPIMNAVMFRLDRPVVEAIARREDIDLGVTNVSGQTIRDILARLHLPQYDGIFD